MAAGGPRLHEMSLEPELFGAAAVRAVPKNLMAMKMAELKEELEARELSRVHRSPPKGAREGSRWRLDGPSRRHGGTFRSAGVT